MSRVRRLYPSDLDELQWQHIERMLPTASSRGRPRQICLRRVIEAIFYLNRTGCAWRYLPREFPRWQTVYAYYASWNRKRIIQKIHDYLVGAVRRLEKRRPMPSALIVDSQSIKAPWGGQRGYDGFKKVIGRKRSIFVDTLGLIHSVRVDAANLGEYKSACEMLENEKYFPKSVKALAVFYADAGYRPHDFQNAVHRHCGIWPTLSKSAHRLDGIKGKVLTASNLKP